MNPPQGTYVDTGFVEQSEVINGVFDFFLVPHSVTQGAVKPTHFYVASNTSEITKEAILNFTYALCYNYYNWADSIKIPAPCMLADKIAIYRSEIGNIPSNIDLHRLPFYIWNYLFVFCFLWNYIIPHLCHYYKDLMILYKIPI